MIAVSNKPTKKKLITYGLVITLMIIGNLIIYYRNSKPTAIEEEDLGMVSELNGKSGQKSASGKTVLSHNLFIALKKIGDWPITPKNVGKADPFAPIFNQ